MDKSSPNLTKFCRHDHKGLVNTSRTLKDHSNKSHMTIQAAQKSPKDHSNKWIKPKNEELKKLEDSNTESSKRQEIEFNSKAQRAQGGKGLLSQSISVQESQKSLNKVLVLEKKEKNRRKGGRGRPGEKVAASGCLAPGAGELAALPSLLTH